MSAGAALQGAIVAGLRRDLAGFAVFDAPPVRAATPHAIVEDPVLGDWSTKDWRGREGRVAVVLVDAGERPVRVRAAIGVVEDCVEGVARADGWRVVTLRLVRARVAKAGGERWRATIEFQVRMVRD